MTDLPKTGDRISADKFHVSEFNVRYGEPFGEAEEDLNLIAQLRHGKILGPFRARPEGEGFGVVVGRRRFLAKRELGAEFFVVGQDCIIEKMTDEQAIEDSLVENLQALRREINPVTRAKRLNEIISFSSTHLRGTARRLGVPPSTLCEWLKVLQLSGKMKDALARGLLTFSDGVALARLKLGEALQDELADVLEKEGPAVFKKEVARISAGKGRRGIPKGKYIFIRTTFDRHYKPDVQLYEQLSRLAQEKRMKTDEYCKEVLREHVNQAG